MIYDFWINTTSVKDTQEPLAVIDFLSEGKNESPAITPSSNNSSNIILMLVKVLNPQIIYLQSLLEMFRELQHLKFWLWQNLLRGAIDQNIQSLISKSISQPTNRSIDQSINQSIIQSVNQCVSCFCWSNLLTSLLCSFEIVPEF